MYRSRRLVFNGGTEATGLLSVSPSNTALLNTTFNDLNQKTPDSLRISELRRRPLAEEQSMGTLSIEVNRVMAMANWHH